MIKSVRSRTLVAIVSLIILALLIGLIFCFTFANSYYVNVKEREMLNIYNSISSYFDVSYKNREFTDKIRENDQETKEDLDPEENTLWNDFKNFYFAGREDSSELAELCDENGVSLLIMEPNGKPAFVYGNESILQDRLDELTLNLNEDDIVNVVDENESYIIQTVSDERTGDIEYIEMWGIFQSQRAFIARSSFSGIQNSIRVALYFFLFVFAVILIIAAVIIYVLSHSYSKPLRRLVDATKGATEFDFDEIQEGLGTENRKDELGVLGSNITKMSRQLYDSNKELKNTNLKLRNELKAKESLDEQRKRYISDISHELKTPIALISGYAEGLKEGVGATKEDQDYYLDVIIDESEKMNLMVKRISALNKLEQGQSDVNLERFNVIDVINGYLNTMALIFDERQIEVYFDNRDKIFVWADEFLFEEVLMNYINNALNHVDDNKTIKVNVEYDDAHARVTVFNTGKNIPEEDLDRIWGEFYKVDKARTRAYGGSGLGLSIVKAIAETTDEECGVYNTEDGVAFWIELELDKVQEYEEPKKKARLSELPSWQTTTNILKDRAEKNAQKREQAAKEKAEKKELIAREKAEKKELIEREKAEKKTQLEKEKAERNAKKQENAKTRRMHTNISRTQVNLKVRSKDNDAGDLKEGTENSPECEMEIKSEAVSIEEIEIEYIDTLAKGNTEDAPDN